MDESLIKRQTQLDMIMDDINESRYESNDKEISGENDEDTPIFDNMIKKSK